MSMPRIALRPMLPLLLLMPMVTACVPKSTGSSPIVLEPVRLTPLPAAVKEIVPPPSGEAWSELTDLRKSLRAELKPLEDKSAPFRPN